MTEEKERKKGRGGDRGGRRPKTLTPQKSMHILLDHDLIEIVEQQPNKNRFINECIRKKKESE